MRKNDMKLFNKSIYDYLVLNHEHFSTHGVCYKLSGAITCKQVALAVGLGNETYHDILMRDLISKIGPGDDNYDVRFDYDAVKLFAYDYVFIIHLPRSVSYQQYKMLEDIVMQVRQFEKDYNIEIKPYPSFEFILEDARHSFNTWLYIERGEKIVGTPINEQYIIDSINSSLEIEKCNDFKYFNRAIRILLKYYHDNFFKDVIVKMLSNDEYYENIFNKLLMAYENFDEKKIEEEYHTLIKNESQKREEWEKDSSSYDLYLNYKNSIRDRLEFKKIIEDFKKTLSDRKSR